MTRSDTSSNTISVGVIGCGRIAQAVHIPLLARLHGTRVAALADIDASRLSRAGALAPHAACFSDYRQLLAAGEVSAVAILAPPALHTEIAIAALDAGKDVYIEKPLATIREDGERVCEAWRRSGRVGMIGFNYRFNRLYRQARAHLSQGTVGPVVAVRSVFATTSNHLPEWKRARSSGGGALLDLASHDIDLVHFILGQDIVEVYADLHSLSNEDDSALLHLRLADGVPVQLFVALDTTEEAIFEVYGRRGKVTVNRYQSVAAQVTGTYATGRLRKVWNGVAAFADLPWYFHRLKSPLNEPSFAAALEHFVGAICGHHAAAPNVLDGYRSLCVVAAAEESARTGRSVPVELPALAPTREPSAAGAARPAVSGGDLK